MTCTRSPLLLPQKRNRHPFLGKDARATSTGRPEPLFLVGTKVPALQQPVPRYWPASASRSGNHGPVFKAPVSSSRSCNQGPSGLGAAKTRRSPARESQASHPLAAAGLVRTRCPAEVRPAQPRSVQTRQEDQGRGARAPKAAGTRAHSGQSLNPSSRTGPVRFPQPSAPPPALASSLGRLWSSTPLFGFKGTETLHAQRAGCGHKSRGRVLLPHSLSRGYSQSTPRPGQHPMPCPMLSLSGPGGPRPQGVKPGAS